MPVPPMGEVGRREARQRLVELEDAARRNYAAAEEARDALAREHARLNLETEARNEIQREALLLRHELDKARAQKVEEVTPWQQQQRARAGSEVLRDELAQLREQHARAVAELELLRAAAGSSEAAATAPMPNEMLAEYADRLRVAQEERASIQAQFDRVTAERQEAQAALERAAVTARERVENEATRVTELERALAAMTQDRDRLRTEIEQLGSAAPASDHLARLEARVAEAEERAREAERVQGRIRRDASEVGKAKRAIETAHAEVVSERDRLREELAATHAELARLMADNEQMRAHASSLGNELATYRAHVAISAANPAAESGAVEEPAAPERAGPRPDGTRRHAMAELTAIAATSGDDDFSFRRR
ncbi:MAG TPA: hypothetical protein VFR41_11370 [Acidimicrobiia bacterium]|nr:hypothetical protein [Acidimicrobiia bacterium]